MAQLRRTRSGDSTRAATRNATSGGRKSWAPLAPGRSVAGPLSAARLAWAPAPSSTRAAKGASHHLGLASGEIGIIELPGSAAYVDSAAGAETSIARTGG